MKKTALLKLTAATALCVVLFFSCNKGTLLDRVHNSGRGNVRFNGTIIDDYSLHIQDPQPSLSFYCSDAYHYYLTETLYVHNLSEKIMEGINVAKNEQLLQNFVKELRTQKDERVATRAEFLRGFYEDLYTLSAKSFFDKYQKHCSRELLKRLNFTYKLMHETNQDGYAWVAFTDNRRHSAEDFSFSHLDYKFDTLDKPYFDCMYQDIYWLREDPFPYYDREDKWYKVRMGDSDVMVKVEGLGKRIAITGVINSAMNVWINTWYDR